MAIDLLRDRTIMAMPESVAPTYTPYAAKSKAVAAYSAPSTVKTQEPDEVSFTEGAKSVARATDLAMKADGIDYEKVAAIKHQLETGTFEFNDERTALKMLGADSELDFLLS
ncbi:MAG TPA: flagellar biosynthesis anti-sigma factor FlgM [Candidatus Anaerobiospirillum stercoravium]|nr:flagellar biosynthesis anti-sigma factor FlgM [Candidatus Anaerobiospirillum stercoravium]